MERVRRHLVVVQEHGAGDGEVDAERDARCHDLRGQGLGEPLPARAGDLQDQQHHDHRAGEQPAVGAGEAGQGVHLGVLFAERPSPGEPAARPAARGAQRLFRAEAGAADQRHRRDGHDPRHQSRVDVLGFQVLDQAGNLLGQPGQAAQQADHGTGRRGDRHPPPVPAEPARVGIAVPLAPELDHSDEHQAGERAEHPEDHRVTHQHPELPLLGDRRRRGRPGRDAHDADLSGAELPPRHRRQQHTGPSRSATRHFDEPRLGIPPPPGRFPDEPTIGPPACTAAEHKARPRTSRKPRTGRDRTTSGTTNMEGKIAKGPARPWNAAAGGMHGCGTSSN